MKTTLQLALGAIMVYGGIGSILKKGKVSPSVTNDLTYKTYMQSLELGIIGLAGLYATEVFME